MRDHRDIYEVIADTVNHLAQRGDAVHFHVEKAPVGQKPKVSLIILSDRHVDPVQLSDYLENTLAEINRPNIERGKAGFGSWDEVVDALFKYTRNFAASAGRQCRRVE